MFDEENHHPRENPITFYSSPATLASIASSAAAMVCWHHHLDHLYLDEISNHGYSWFSLDLSSIEIYQLPNRIRDQIDRRIKFNAKELKRWWLYHHELFEDDGYKMIMKYFDYLVLDSNGNIGCKATARNILASGKLSPVEEFRICCAYCFEPEINRLWPSVSEDDHFKDVDFNEYPTLYYWICRMRNDLTKIPGDQQHSIEYRLLILSEPDKFNLWPQIEYLWEKLNEDEKLSHIGCLVSEGHFAKYLLPKLNKAQLDEALKTCSSNILYSLTKHDSANCNFAPQAWNYMKDKISKYQFGSILYKLYRLAFIEEKFHLDHAAVFIYHVWSTAPEDFRRRILKMDCDSYFDYLLGPEDDGDMRWYGRDMRFFLDILAKSNSEQIVHKFWTKNWRKVMLIATPADLLNCLKLIWDDDEEEIEFFKENYIMVYEKASASFDKFIEFGLTDELIEYLKYFSSNDEEKVRKVMKEIIDSNLDRMHKFSYNSLVKFNDFIDKAFSSPDSAKQFKRENIRGRVESWYDLLNQTHLNGVRNMAEFFLSSDTDLLVEIKRRCFEICKQNVTNGIFKSFRIREWQEFFLWCALNEQELAKFKKSIQIDVVFDVILTKMMKGDYVVTFENKTMSDFAEVLKKAIPRSDIIMSTSPVKGFLLWYFEDRQAATKFKLDKIYNYSEVGALVGLFDARDGIAIGHVLNWFFDNDEEKIEKFCKDVDFLRFSDDEEDEDEASDEDEEVSESREEPMDE